MEKPMYVNGFAVSYNNIQNEVIISCLQEYPSTKINGENINLESTRDIVASFVMSKYNAERLVNLLIPMLKERIDDDGTGESNI